MSASDPSLAVAAGAKTHGVAFVLGATLCWSTSGILLRIIDVSEWTAVFWRSSFLALAMTAYVLWRYRSRAPQAVRALGISGVVVAALIAATFILYVMAISLTLVANALVLMSAAPLVAASFGWLLLGERPRIHTVMALAVASGGVLVMLLGPREAAFAGTARLGDLLALGVALCFGLAIVLMRRAKHVDMVPAMGLAGVFAALAALPFAALASPSPTDFALLAGMGVFQLALGFLLFARGAPLLTPAEVGLLTLVEVVISPLWVWIGVGEVPGQTTFLGGGIILGALVVHSAYGIRRSKPPVGMA